MLKPSIIKLCGEITALSIFISNTTEHDVFVSYSGHVNYFDLAKYQNGWKEDEERNPEVVKIDLKRDFAEEKLIALKRELENIINGTYAINDQLLNR